MTTIDDLLGAVDAAFVETGAGLDPWPNPRAQGDDPADEEYSRVTNPERWRIVSARAEAWEVTLEALGIATVERRIRSRWLDGDPSIVSRVDRVVPIAADALPMLVARTTAAGIADFGVMLGFGEPAAQVALIPSCGCDACDGGSTYELEALDERVLDIVSGVYRQVRDRGGRRYWARNGSGAGGSDEGVQYDLSGAPWVEPIGSW